MRAEPLQDLPIDRIGSTAPTAATGYGVAELASRLTGLSFDGPTNAFCITVYNESREKFEQTIRSLLLAVRYFHEQPARTDGLSLLCVICDGREALDASVLELMVRAGFITDRAVRFSGTDLHITLNRWDVLLRALGVEPRGSSIGTLAPVAVVVCLKDRNQGKLQSHRLFFDLICRELQPTWCFQIDCATTLAEHAVLRLVEHMERAPDVAAVAPRILLRTPEPAAGLLADWQYLDFALQKAILWPFEMATGHLSVIPGQACAFRWTALQGATALQGPLDTYLLGAQTPDPFCRLMYLAEDRVIGNQIVLTPHNRWRLVYAPDADAATDRCGTLGELLRQRRRWRNGALTCRVWMLRKWRHFLLRSDRSAASKAVLSNAMLSQLLLLVLDFFAPAQLIALLAVFAKGLAKANTVHDHIIQVSLAGVLAFDLLVARRGRANDQVVSPRIAYRCAVGLVSTLLLVAAIVSALPPAATVLLLLAPMITMPAVLLALPSDALVTLARAKFFPLTELAAVSVLSWYALWNFNDVSWGTKGLTRSVSDRLSAKTLRRWRNTLFTTWVAGNACAVAIAVSVPGVISSSLNPIVEIAGIAQAITAAVALVGVIRSRRRAQT